MATGHLCPTIVLCQLKEVRAKANQLAKEVAKPQKKKEVTVQLRLDLRATRRNITHTFMMCSLIKPKGTGW